MAFNKENVTANVENVLVYGINLKNQLLPYINLSNEQKSKLGLRTFDNEPEYILNKKDDSGIEYKQAVIELYVKPLYSELLVNNEIYPIRFYIDNIQRDISQTGKYQYINNDGQTQWLMSPEDTVDNRFMTNTTGLRIAYKGEVDFLDALKSMNGINSGISISNWNKIFNGDFSEIKETLKSVQSWYLEKNKKQKEFSLLFSIATKEKVDDQGINKTYFVQNIYTQAFTENTIRKKLQGNEKRGYPYKNIYQDNGILTNYLKRFNPSSIDEDKNDNNSLSDFPFGN